MFFSAHWSPVTARQSSKQLVGRVLKLCTDESTNPDLRDLAAKALVVKGIQWYPLVFHETFI